MSPENEEQPTNVATAEPTAGPESQPLETPQPQPAPGAEQEQPKPDEGEGASAAGAPEDEGEAKGDEAPDVKAQLAEALKDLPPELRLTPEEQERLRTEAGPPALDGANEMRGVRHLGRLKEVGETLEGAKGQAWGELNQAYTALDQEVQRQAQSFTGEDGQKLAPDVTALRGALLKYQTDYGTAAESYAKTWHSEQARAALEGHPVFGLLSKEEQAGWDATWSQRADEGLTRDAIGYLLSVALERGAPEATKLQAKAAAEQDVGLAGALAKIQEYVGQNGVKPRKGAEAGSGGGKTKQPRNEEEARNWHATGEWTGWQMREYLARARS
ncbi:hypothetical protein LCGC14_0445140 [marine sediment metagenome]|uniref:Uncharacterized protein n=1 Tax=marine sediment metagenome TaxID=412755 RepID=A0A0F9T2I2_9ZZZZ